MFKWVPKSSWDVACRIPKPYLKAGCIKPSLCRKELVMAPCFQCGVWDFGVQLTRGIFGNFSQIASPAFASPPSHVPEVLCTSSIYADLSTPLSQTTNNISADSCPQCFSRAQSLSESPKQHPVAQLDVLHGHQLGVKDSKCGLKKLPSARVRSWGLLWMSLSIKLQLHF